MHNVTNPVSIAELCQAVAANAKTNKWFSCTTPVLHNGQTYHVGVKAFGLWVQIVECNGMRSSVYEQKTQRALKAALATEIEGVMR